MRTTFFDAHPSPIGAFASFTFGHQGGPGLELGRPANANLILRLEEKPR